MGKFRRSALIFCLSIFGWSIAYPSDANTENIQIKLKISDKSLLIENKGQDVYLQSTIVVEMKNGGDWKRVPVSNFYLRSSCDLKIPPSCIHLSENSSLESVEWTGKYCSSQCAESCRAEWEAPQGIYRFVISSCDGKNKYFSNDFEMK